ncbi:VQ motif-containing protein 4 [Gastrolobium bilobum]|uniref:VQ motif-containing protein 4 n=1 Tax=Gastrolobium bilobum TaxID=150636 RepID=UPI002AB0B41D|nr:VQ motif-containing protein 4 [Gastrolobium bilobum]
MDSMSPRYQENNHKQSLILHTSNTNGLLHPQPPKPITRSEPANPYPTTFVQADTSSFKQVVQMLTGSSETAKQASCSKPTNPTHNIPPIKSIPKKQQQHQQQQSGFKLYERRNSLKNLNINPLIPVFSSSSNNSGFSPRKPEILSPSILDFPSLVLSPVTPLIPDPFDRSATPGFVRSPSLDAEAEEKAIKEKGFFLHPSPASTPRDAEPRLLPLFPTTSPRASGPSSAS